VARARSLEQMMETGWIALKRREKAARQDGSGKPEAER
jgi:hypothetical protein